jgi:hypothetical protein
VSLVYGDAVPRTSTEAGPAGGNLQVRVRRRGRWTARHRSAFRVRSTDRAAAESALSALLLGAHEVEGTADPLGLARYAGVANPLEVEISADPPREDSAGAAWLALTIRVPFVRLALVPAGKSHRGHLSIFAVAGGLESGVQPVRKAEVPVRVANEELVVSQGRQVEYRFELPLVAREGRVAVTVRDDLAAITSTVILALDGGERPSGGAVEISTHRWLSPRLVGAAR